MKLGFVFCLLTAFILTTVEAKTLVVSDIDDTLKVTNVLNTPAKILNSLFSKRAFAGMAELLQELYAEETTVYYLSASPVYLEGRIHGFLLKNHFPQIHQLVLRKEKLGLYDYKLKAIRELIKKVNPEKIILLGDDTQFDPEVYNTIYKENLRLVHAIYIRSIKNRELPHNPVLKSFFSPVEIAGFEYLDNQFTEASFKIVANGFLNQTEHSKIFLRHRYCPEQGRVELEEIKQKVHSPLVMSLLEETQQKITDVCR